jgi:hypothetical protein
VTCRVEASGSEIDACEQHSGASRCAPKSDRQYTQNSRRPLHCHRLPLRLQSVNICSLLEQLGRLYVSVNLMSNSPSRIFTHETLDFTMCEGQHRSLESCASKVSSSRGRPTSRAPRGQRSRVTITSTSNGTRAIRSRASCANTLVEYFRETRGTRVTFHIRSCSYERRHRCVQR